MADQLIIRGAREHNLKDVSLDLPRDCAHRLHRACRAPASRAWPSTRSSPRGSAATSSRCRPTPASSSVRWTSRTSTSSRASRPRCRSTRSPRRRTRARPSAPSPRSTTTSACSTPAPAGRTAPSVGPPSSGRPRSRSSTGCWPSRRAPASRCWRRSSAAARASTSSCSASCRPTGFSRARVNGETYPLDEPPKLDKQKKHTIEVVVDRLAVKESCKRRLTDSVETALGLAERSGGLRLRRPRRQGPGPRDEASPSGWPAPTTTPSTPTSSSPARSPSTRPSARARSATASAPGWRSTRSWSCPTRAPRSARARSSRGATPTSPTTSCAW